MRLQRAFLVLALCAAWPECLWAADATPAKPTLAVSIDFAGGSGAVERARSEECS